MTGRPPLPPRPQGVAELGDLLMLQIRPPALLACRPDGSNVRAVIADLGHTPDGIQVDAQAGLIYWTNMGADFDAADGTIERARLDGSERVLLVGDGAITTPKQLALDRAGGHLYWCDREGMRVMRAGLDGRGVETLVRRGSGKADVLDQRRHCVGIAIDPVRRLVYWTQKGPDDGGVGRIFRASMDLPVGATADHRSDIEVLASDLPEPIDLHLDASTEQLYWTDRGGGERGNTLNRAAIDADGLGPTKIVATGFREAIGLAIDEERQVAFASDLGGHIRRVDLRKITDARIVRVGPATGLTLVA